MNAKHDHKPAQNPSPTLDADLENQAESGGLSDLGAGEIVSEGEILAEHETEIKSMQERINMLETENNDHREKMLRLAAEFENFRKRARRENEDSAKFGIERLLRDFLPVIDNLERALSHAQGDTSPLVEGIRMVAKQSLDVLAGYGVESFEALRQPFDPEKHEALGHSPSNDVPAGNVAEVIAKGYMLHSRLLRPARVIIAAAVTGNSDS